MMRTRLGILIGLLAMLVTLGGASCAKTAVELPDTPPSIAGTITSLDVDGEHLGSLRVEAVPGEEAGSDKAVVRIEQGTALLTDSGRKIGLSQFKVGRKVRAWFTGPVRESYPVQADAATVILEPAGK
ncbi:MAG: DUF3221 domain-containing protein [Candidatus Eisenbacteria bacterium]